ncbi:MAG TPA: NAD(P)-binding domain-containing protein [Vicinamibacterales bacterium]|nr:NAD(P)-binding domain-containing protein [Vicinamibacterales bacterium]
MHPCRQGSVPASDRRTDLLIVGAGPFGLSMAAHARHLGIDHLVVGEPMQFWRAHMPAGMYLRSDCKWHLDPENVDTVHAFLQCQNLSPAAVEPLSRDFYLKYTRWFQQRKQIDPWPVVIERLDVKDDGMFRASIDGGGSIAAKQVVLALGFAHFSHVPGELPGFPSHRAQHTCDYVDFSRAEGKRFLIVGGRQSAFEWAALLREAGASAVHVSHRHDSPAFAPSDWSWVGSLVDGLVDNPAWYRNLTQAEKDDLSRRFWVEGRLKLEPWLAPRVERDPIRLWPNTRLVECREAAGGTVRVTLNGPGRSQALDVDRIVLATGYKPDITRVPLLTSGNLLPRLRTVKDLPVLDEHFQTSIPGLFMTSMAATAAFGPFFAFTVSVRASAKLIGQALAAV